MGRRINFLLARILCARFHVVKTNGIEETMKFIYQMGQQILKKLENYEESDKNKSKKTKKRK